MCGAFPPRPRIGSSRSSRNSPISLALRRRIKERSSLHSSISQFTVGRIEHYILGGTFGEAGAVVLSHTKVTTPSPLSGANLIFLQLDDIHGHSCDSADDRRIDRVAHLLGTGVDLNLSRKQQKQAAGSGDVAGLPNVAVQ